MANRMTWGNEGKSALKTFKKFSLASLFSVGLSFLKYKIWRLVQISAFQIVPQGGAT